MASVDADDGTVSYQSLTDSEAPEWTRSSTSSIQVDPLEEFQLNL